MLEATLLAGDIRFGDGQKLILGSDLVTNDLELYHGGLVIIMDMILVDTGNLYLKSGVSGGYLIAKGADLIELHHNGTTDNNSMKLETSNTGVTVTGALTAGGLTYPTTNGTSGQVFPAMVQVT